MSDEALQHVQDSLKPERLQGVEDRQRVVDAKVFDIHRFVDRYRRGVQVLLVGVLHHKVFGHHHKGSAYDRRGVWMSGPGLLRQGVRVSAHQRMVSFLRPYWPHSVTRVGAYKHNA